MKKPLLAIILMIAAAGAWAKAGWRDKIASLWAEQPVSMDGGEEQWQRNDKAEESSVSFRAMNDASDLYLFISPIGREGKGLLSGGYRQDVTVWFIGPDQQTRVWGLRVPYSRYDQLTPGTTEAVTIQPEYVTMQDTAISTAPMPSGITVFLPTDVRRPLLEVRVALKLLPPPQDNQVPLDLTTTAVSLLMAEQIRNEKIEEAGGPHEEGRRRGRRHENEQSGTQLEPVGSPSSAAPEAPPSPPTVPVPLDLEMSVKLASSPG
jgi:hypothetical protein